MGFAVEQGGPTPCKNKLIAFFLLAIRSRVASTRLRSERETRWYDYGDIIKTTQHIWSIRELISRLFSRVKKFTAANPANRATPFAVNRIMMAHCPVMMEGIFTYGIFLLH